MPNARRIPVFLLIFALLLARAAGATAGGASGIGDGTGDSCLQMTVSATDLASPGNRARQQYRIRFENRCDSVRIVYWCAENPSKSLTMNSVCSRGAAAPQAGIAAPLYAVVRQREFQWTFPPGTRIRYVDCRESAYPTSDFRCRATSALR